VRAREAVFRSRRRRPDAERPAGAATRSSRLGGASAISFKRYSALGRTMELGRSRRTLVAAPRRSLLTGVKCRGMGGALRGRHQVCRDEASVLPPTIVTKKACLKCARTPAVSGSGRKLSFPRSNNVGQVMRDQSAMWSSGDSRYGTLALLYSSNFQL